MVRREPRWTMMDWGALVMGVGVLIVTLVVR